MATRDIHRATVPARFLTCPPTCPECAQCPGHRAAEYQFGVRFGEALARRGDTAASTAIDLRLEYAEPGAETFLAGIRDTLTVVTA